MVNGVFVGLSTIDLVYRVGEFPSPNSKVVAQSQDVFVGGPATNAAITFKHLGGNSTLVTTVGSHALANVIFDELSRFSIRLNDLNPCFNRIPAISSIAVNEAGERDIISANATRIDGISNHVDESILEDASVVLVDGHFMPACQAWAKAARARGIQVVFDGGSWKDGTEELLRSVDTAICSAYFVPPGCSTEGDVFTYLKSHGVTTTAITKGAEQICYSSNLTNGTLQIKRIHVVDTMGAGDIFHGAFCYYSALGRDVAESLAGAAKIATESCRFHGTREWMKHVSF
jgi:sugar/nucleoside kinase (ribokinase family)